MSVAATGDPAQQEARAGALSKAETKAVRQVRRLAPRLSVASAKTADTATSAQAANTANTATVGGIDVKKISTVIPTDGAPVALEVVATQGSNNVSESGFSLTVPAGASLGSLTLELVSASGKVVNAWVGYRNDAPGCACYFGNYMVG